MTYIALLRAVNIGGTGKLAMKDLVAICRRLGFKNARTYIQSGNVVFESESSESDIQAKLENALEKKMSKRVDVMIRSAVEMRRVMEANPFAGQPPAKVAVAFLSERTTKQTLENVLGLVTEQVSVGKRELYLYFPDGMGKSKLRYSSAMGPVTARNINTVTKLVEMSINGAPRSGCEAG